MIIVCVGYKVIFVVVVIDVWSNVIIVVGWSVFLIFYLEGNF